LETTRVEGRKSVKNQLLVLTAFLLVVWGFLFWVFSNFNPNKPFGEIAVVTTVVTVIAIVWSLIVTAIQAWLNNRTIDDMAKKVAEQVVKKMTENGQK